MDVTNEYAEGEKFPFLPESEIKTSLVGQARLLSSLLIF